jgi:fructokinase
MILCCGEALIDMLPRRSDAGEAVFAPYSGGAVFNTAIALGRLGVPVSFFTGLSTDFFGDQLKAELRASNVDSRHFRLSDRPTTLAFVKLSNGHASYAFFDENSAGRMLAEADLPSLGDEIRALHFSCISLIPEPCGSTYEALMRREYARRVTMLDPNLRPAFVKDRARHLQRMYRMIAMADIVKLSDEDIAWFGEAGSHGEIAARWLRMGPKLVVITAGAKGAKGYLRDGRIDVPAPSVAVADTVGAGDTFNAGILASLHDQGLLTKEAVAGLTIDQAEAALRLAARAAAVTVSRAGANPPWRAELTQA